MRKTMACLAKSYKHGNFCVAGKELLPNDAVGAWIRPVHPVHDSVPKEAFPYSVRDIVSLDIAHRQSKTWQKENHVLAEKINMRHEGRISHSDLDRFLDTPEGIWGAGESSSQGLNDRVPESQIYTCKHTLLFLFLKRVVIWQKQSDLDDSCKLRLNFIYKGAKYPLAITDPAVLDAYKTKLKANEYEPINDCYVTLSLGLPYHGYCYKLAASILHV